MAFVELADQCDTSEITIVSPQVPISDGVAHPNRIYFCRNQAERPFLFFSAHCQLCLNPR